MHVVVLVGCHVRHLVCRPHLVRGRRPKTAHRAVPVVGLDRLLAAMLPMSAMLMFALSLAGRVLLGAMIREVSVEVVDGRGEKGEGGSVIKLYRGSCRIHEDHRTEGNKSDAEPERL